MGEIKSTLEIIMEKTKDLTLTEEERKEFKQKDMAGKIKGVIQKFLDGIIDLNRLKMEIAALEKDNQDMVTRLVMDELLPRIKLQEDNALFLQILDIREGIDTAPIKEILADFEKRLAKERAVQEKELMKSLKDKGVSGSAVIPNPNADPDGVNNISEMKKEFEERLRLYRKNLFS
ncbi:MAG: hypothetical protein JRI52_11085 [Deltaproteobacteria bacterium]|nr:hypothetical protein [Deltaproteobacteria bacterium]